MLFIMAALIVCFGLYGVIDLSSDLKFSFLGVILYVSNCIC